MNRIKRWLALGLLGALTTLGLVACGGGGDGPSGTAQPLGTLKVGLTDAPSCKVGKADLAKVWVTVERVRVHASADAADSASGWSEIVLNPTQRVDLLSLTNGTLFALGTTPLPAGAYTQVRLVLSPNRGAAPYANAVVLVGSTAEIPLDTPSAAQSGLKIIRPFTVAPNTVVDLVIDFDACRSIVARGNGSYALKPVLSASLVTVAAIQGYVDPTVPGVLVSAQKNGEVVRSTVPAADGKFLLAYLDAAAAPFDVVITAPARATAVVSGVPATTTALTQLNASTAPIGLVLSGANLASGVVGPAAARDTAWVRALQAVGPVPRVEVAWANVDPLDGSYLLSLPTAAPRWAPYAASGLFFQTQNANAAAYTLQAGAFGFAAQNSALLDLSAPRSWNFTLIPAP